MPVPAVMVEDGEHLIGAECAVLARCGGHPVDEACDIADDVALLNLIVEHCGCQVQQVVTRPRRPLFAAFDFAAPQPAHQCVEIGFRQLLDLEVSEFVAQRRAAARLSNSRRARVCS